MDGRKNNKGTIGNKGGRPSMKLEEKKNYVISQVMKRLTGEEEEDEATILFMMQWCEVDPKGAYKFIHEHKHGKPKEVQESTLINGTERPIIIMGKSKAKDE